MIPMPDAMIAAVEARAMEEGQPIIEGGCLHFEWQPNMLLPEAEDVPQDEQQQQPLDTGALNLLAELAEGATPAAMVDPVDNANNDADMPIINFGEQHPHHNNVDDSRSNANNSFQHADDGSLNMGNAIYNLNAIPDQVPRVEAEPNALPNGEPRDAAGDQDNLVSDDDLDHTRLSKGEQAAVIN